MYLLCKSEERLVDVNVVTGRALIDPQDAIVSTEKHCLLSVHFTPPRLREHDIHFVGHEGDCAVGGRDSFDFLEPVVQVDEGVKAGDVAHQNHTVCPSVVVAGDGLVYLAARCVPDLHIHHCLVFHFDKFARELNPDCRLGSTTLTVYELLEDT